MSSGNDFQGPWNQGNSTRLNEPFQYIDDPIAHVMETNGLINQKPKDAENTPEQVEKMNKKLGKTRSTEVNTANAPKTDVMEWNDTPAASNGKKKTTGSK
jgi:Mn-containing catalase